MNQRKRITLRMTYSTSGVHVSLQRDAFSLVHLYKKRETYECIEFFLLFYPYSVCSRHGLRIQLSQTFSHTAFANYPSDLLLHVSITRCVRSLTSCFFFPRYTHSLFSFTISQKSSHLEQMPKSALGYHHEEKLKRASYLLPEPSCFFFFSFSFFNYTKNQHFQN